MELRIGGPPHTFRGSENSSGYAHQLEIEDEAVVACRQVWDREDSRLCGASRGFAYELWPLKPGRSTVRINGDAIRMRSGGAAASGAGGALEALAVFSVMQRVVCGPSGWVGAS